MESNLQQTLAGRCFDGGSYLPLSSGVEKAAAARRPGGGTGRGAGGTVLAPAGPDPPGAADYLRAHPEAVCITTGGQGRDEPRAEGDAAKQALEAFGIAPERITAETVVTYGLSPRDSLTLSSLAEPVLCVQRQLPRPDGTVIEPQEFPLPALPGPAAELLPLLGARLLRLPQTADPFLW